MNIIHIQTAFTGMGNAPYRLHMALLNKGYSSLLINEESIFNNDRILRLGARSNRDLFYNQLLCSFLLSGKKDGSYYYSANPINRYGIAHLPEVINADLIFLHWTNDFFLSLGDIKDICSLNKPVVFVFHDKWYMTGGCHHNFDCKAIKKGCLFCPMFNWWNIYPSIQYLYKKKLYQNFSNLYFLNFSQWMNNCFINADIYKREQMFVIPPYIDDKVYCPIDKTNAKIKLGIDPNKKVISFGSIGALSNEFKGWRYLKKALNLIPNPNDLVLLVFGNHDNSNDIDFPMSTKKLGIIKDENKMRIVNSCSDVFVSPSLVESYGMAIMENLLCGTPVVAFKTASTPELIKHEKNGYLAEYRSSEDLAYGIQFVLNNINRNNFEKPDYNSNEILKEYIDMIENIYRRN